MNQKARRRRDAWTLERAGGFTEAEAKTRAQWHAATSAQRFQAAAQLRFIVYGKAATARLQRFLELVPGP